MEEELQVNNGWSYELRILVKNLDNLSKSSIDEILVALTLLNISYLICKNNIDKYTVNNTPDIDNVFDFCKILSWLLEENNDDSFSPELIYVMVQMILLIDGLQKTDKMTIARDLFLYEKLEFYHFNILLRSSVDILLADAMSLRFNILKNISDLDSAIELLQQSTACLKCIVPDADIFNYSIYELSFALFQGGRLTESLRIFQQLQTTLEQQGNLNLLALTMYEIARIYHRLGRLEQARLYFKDAVRLFRRLEDSKRVAAALTGLGNLELQTGHFSNAQQHLDEARQYYETELKADRVEEIEKLLALLPVKNNAINQSTSCQGV